MATRKPQQQQKPEDKCPSGWGEIGTLTQRWWKCKMVLLLWKTVGSFLNILKIELPWDPAIPLVVIPLKELKVGS